MRRLRSRKVAACAPFCLGTQRLARLQRPLLLRRTDAAWATWLLLQLRLAACARRSARIVSNCLHALHDCVLSSCCGLARLLVVPPAVQSAGIAREMQPIRQTGLDFLIGASNLTKAQTSNEYHPAIVRHPCTTLSCKIGTVVDSANPGEGQAMISTLATCIGCTRCQICLSLAAQVGIK